MRSPEKFFQDLFFGEHLRLCPWSLALASKGLILGLGPEPCVLDSTSGQDVKIWNCISENIKAFSHQNSHLATKTFCYRCTDISIKDFLFTQFVCMLHFMISANLCFGDIKRFMLMTYHLFFKSSKCRDSLGQSIENHP